MATLQIIGVPQSTYVRAVRIAAREKAIDYELITERPHSPPVDAIHPLGKIPVMRHGDFVLAESRAIAGYIDCVFPGPRLFPPEPVAAARVEQWVSLTNTAFDPVMIRRYVLAYVVPKDPGGPNRAVIDAAVGDMRQQIAILDQATSRAKWIAGDEFTFADANLAPILHYLGLFPESGALIAGAPNLAAYAGRLAARPTVEATVPPKPRG